MSPRSGLAVAQARGGAVAGARGSGVWAVLREDAPALAVFFGPGLLGPCGITVLLLFGLVPGYLGGLLLVLWPAASFYAYLRAYRWAERRGRLRRREAFVRERLPVLAARVISLRTNPAPTSEGVREGEVYALYLRSCRALEGGGLREAEEAVERGVEIADDLLAREGGVVVETKATERSRDDGGR